MEGSRGPRIARWRQAIERSGSGLGWLGVLLAWIFARNLLEGVLERPKMLGFDWREDLSAAMVFLHFPVFYLLVFALLVLWLALVARRPVRLVLPVVAIGFGVLPAAPLLDAAVSRGAGYDLNYLTGFGSFLWRFFDPRVPLSEVSPGQRVEIGLACLLGALYVVAARAERTQATRVQAGSRAAVTVALSLLAAIGVYLLSAFAGAWPSWFARWSWPWVAPSHMDAAIRPWEGVYRLGGLVPSESRRLALVLALPLLLAAGGIAVLHLRGLARGWLGTLPGTRVVYYAGLVPAGAWIAWTSYRPHLAPGVPGPVDAVALVVLTTAMLAAVLAAICWNDAFDREADRINGSTRPVAAGAIDPAAILRLARAFAAVAAFLALLVSYPAFLLLLACLALSWAYSAPPLRLKRIPLIATGALGTLTVLSAMTGFALFAHEAAPAAFPPSIAWALFLGVTLGFTAKDLKDREGDSRTGVITLATLLPPPWDRRGAALLVAIAYAVAGVLLRDALGPSFATGALILTAIFTLIGVVLTLRLRRPDSALLIAFCLYSMIVLAALARTAPEPRRVAADGGGPGQFGLLGSGPVSIGAHRAGAAGILPLHALCLAAEEAQRRSAGRDAPVAAAPRAVDPTAASSALLAHPLAGPERSPWRERALRLRYLAAATDGESPAAHAAAAEAGAWLRARRPFAAEYLDAVVREAHLRRDPALALSASTHAIARGVRVGDFLRHRAAARLAAGDAGAETEADLRGAMLYAADLPACFVLAGDLASRRGQATRASRAYLEAVRLDPTLADAWAGLGALRHAAGRLDESIEAFERARRTAAGAGDPWILNNLGVALRDAGRLDAAEAAFVQAAGAWPRLPQPHVNLGELAERGGRPAEARACYQRALALDPGFAPAHEALARLGRRADGQ